MRSGSVVSPSGEVDRIKPVLCTVVSITGESVSVTLYFVAACRWLRQQQRAYGNGPSTRSRCRRWRRRLSDL